MSIQSTSFNPLFSQQSVSSPTLSSGSSAGMVFDGQGNDFLSPKDILNNVHNFSGSVKPIGSGSSVFGKNPDSSFILGKTSSVLDDILHGSFGVNLAAPIVTHPSAPVVASVPVVGTAVTPAVVATNTTVFGQAFQAPSPALIRDMTNFNPLVWSNPNPTNILLGSMDAQSKIFGGNGIFTPPIFNQFPLFPFIAPPAVPYNNFQIPIPGHGGVNNLQQAQMFPTTFITGSPFFNTFVQPVAVATSQTIIPFQFQVRLAELILARSGAVSSQLLGNLTPIHQLIPPNGIPPWI
jgi:hypothetical protein